MEIEIFAFDRDGSWFIEYDKNPNSCPFCHELMQPKPLLAFEVIDNAEIIFRCTNEDCQHMFIGYYHYPNETYKRLILLRTSTGNPRGKNFSEHISVLSPGFISIYNQAMAAESYNLDHISGMGYRKSLEFLIKDYLIRKHPDRVQNIKDKFLGQCINEDVENSQLKDIAKRAVWLGNDETHYIRKWETKDISDLKIMIDISLHWIEMELLTEKYNNEMK